MPTLRAAHRYRYWTASAVAIALAAPASGAEIIDPGQGAVEIARERSGANGLSGISHSSGDRFFAVSDRTRNLFSLEIRINRASGRIENTHIEKVAALVRGRDIEGIAYTGRYTVLVCDEVGPEIREHRVSDGSLVASIELPRVFTRARHNMSLESLTLEPDGGALWIANEEALLGDGPKSTETFGSTVRLQRFDAERTAAGQWAYTTDPTPGGPMKGFERSGVVDLALLPDGQLLVLERGFGNQGLRARIYEVNFSGATDTSNIEFLEKAQVMPVGKRLLWEGFALGDNYEGMALGVELAEREWSLLLISDDGGVTLPRLYPLKVRLSEPRPANPLASHRSATFSGLGIAAALIGLCAVAWAIWRPRAVHQSGGGNYFAAAVRRASWHSCKWRIA